MTDRFNVLILGYGEMGHAMEHLLERKHELSIWDKFADTGVSATELDQVVPVADFILFCLPVNPHREIAKQIVALLKENSICLSIAKGLDETGQTAAQIFEDVFDDKHYYSVIYGPMISEELRAGRYGFADVGCSDNNIFKQVSRLFVDCRLQLERSNDIAGISWAVILKNVYAILFGVSDGMNLGDNVRGFLAVETLRELSNIVLRMGGNQSSVYQLAGLGDLITTATSESSHHYSLGRKLASGGTFELTGEGVHTCAMVKKFNLFTSSDYTLFSLVSNILDRPHTTVELVNAYLESRQVKLTAETQRTPRKL